MATISASAYNDAAARTAGEAITINTGAVFTQRTDNRVHANAPASFTGSYGSLAFNGLGGEYFLDAQNVREVWFNTGSGTVPAIGTLITNNGSTGYLLGVWASRAVAPTAVGGAMPTTGFIKFREITGGSFAAGALTGINATATGADTSSWIEITYDAASNLVIPRVGKFKSRGQWYELGVTDGNIGQQMQCPSTSIATNNYAPGAEVETAPGSGVYEKWDGLSTVLAGWSRVHIGHAAGYTDKRTKFLKTFGNGIIQFGESTTLSATYASLGAQVGTYAGVSVNGTYTWANDKVLIYVSAGTHLLEEGQSVGIDFTSGGITVDGIYTVTKLYNVYYFEIDYAGSGTGGNVTLRPGLTITFTAHGLNMGELVYCNFTSGSAVSGTYEIYSIDSANAYKIKYPTTTAVTAGAVSCLHTLTVTYTAHGHAIGNEVYCDFTSGGATDGRYIIKAVAANTFNINCPHAAAITTSNVTLMWTIGYVPEAGCKVRIPNIIISECATGSRATNSIPNATITTRPELTTTNAGAIDLEYIFAYSFYTGVIAQAYSLRLRNCFFQDNLLISEIATALDIDNVAIGTYSSPTTLKTSFTSCFAGGTINNMNAQRGGIPASNNHTFALINCFNITVNNLLAGNVQFVRSTGYVSVQSSQNIIFNNLRTINNAFLNTISSVNITNNNPDYVDRYIGHTNATAIGYFVNVGTGCDRITQNGGTIGFGGTIPDCHPYTSLFNTVGSTNIKCRNIGTFNNPLNAGVWAINAYGLATVSAGGGNNIGVKFQKIHVSKLRSTLFSTTNSDKDMLFEEVRTSSPYTYSTKVANTISVACLNALFKGISGINNYNLNQVSVYGSHMFDRFLGDGKQGIIQINMNEPTAETQNYVTVNAGNVKFNSAGGVEMRTIGNQCTWEMQYFAQGHTSFSTLHIPTMTGGTIGNYTLEYQIDTGSGYSAWKTLNTTNLGAESITPTTGLKLKVRVTTITTNTTAITSINIYTNTTDAAQASVSYPLDTATITLQANTPLSGAEIRIYDMNNIPVGSLGSELAGIESNSGASFNFSAESGNQVWIQIMKTGYIEYGQKYTIPTTDQTLNLILTVDTNT